MGKSCRKSATEGEAAPVEATKPLKKGKREPEDDSETKVYLKKQKKDGIAHKKYDKKTTEGFADRLQLIEAKVNFLEAKVDLLTTKADLQAIFISAKGKKDPAKKHHAKADSSSEDSYMDTSSDDDDEVTATKKLDKDAKIRSVKANTENSSSEVELSSDEEPAKKPVASAKPAAITKPAAKDSEDVKSKEESDGGNAQTISVRGFDTRLPVDDIRSALYKYFIIFGEIARVFVPTDLETGVSLGYAYIDMENGAETVLTHGRHNVRGWNLVVGKAEPIRSGSTWPFPGRCGSRGRCSYC